jgi:hypothetical protein
MRMLKEACLWLQEWTSSFAHIRALEVWIAEYIDHAFCLTECHSPKSLKKSKSVDTIRGYTTWSWFLSPLAALPPAQGLVRLCQGADMSHQNMDLLTAQGVRERGHHSLPISDELGQGLVRLLLYSSSV